MKYCLKYKPQHSWLIHSEQSELENDTSWSLYLHPGPTALLFKPQHQVQNRTPLSLALN